MHGADLHTTRDIHAPETGRRRVLVRDLPIRVFHWTLLVTVAVLAVTGFLGPETWLPFHGGAGYVLIALLLFRMVWWFIGGRYSRLSAYPLSIRAIRAHVRGLISGHNDLRAGHNPLGALNIVLMISLLSLLAMTGLVVLGGQELQGPLRAVVSYELGEATLRFHQALAWALLLVVAGHLAGVFLETRICGHPLLTAMISGRMPVSVRDAECGPLTRRGLAAFLAVLVGVGGPAVALSRLPVTDRWHLVQFPAVYVDNCGDCHVVHHPSLRTANMWQRIVAGLQDHYGEDASIDPADAKALLAFLRANDASHYDTEAAMRMGRSESADLRVSSTVHWKRRHAAIPETAFRSAAVGSKANCDACHRDAASGLFADGAIHVPSRANAPKPGHARITTEEKGGSSS